MSAISVILLVAAGTTVAVSAAALHTLRSLRAEVSALRGEVAGPGIPAARPVPAEEIRVAVADALTDERERELAEARAFWAEQDARDCDGPGALLAGRGLEYEVADGDEELLDALLERYLLSDSGYDAPGRDGVAFMPRQQGPGQHAGEPEGGEPCEGQEEPQEPQEHTQGADDAGEEPGDESAELAAARRRHPSHPGYSLSGDPVGQEAQQRAAHEQHRRTAERLSRLAESHTPLADVRPGPLGTLDVYRFADGTTLCLSPGQQEAAERLAAAVRAGDPPVLLGGSGVSGAYALTFSCGRDSVYLLADRVVASSSGAA